MGCNLLIANEGGVFSTSASRFLSAYSSVPNAPFGSVDVAVGGLDSYRFLSGVVMGILLAMSMLLFFMRGPGQPAWRMFRHAKTFTALACLVLSASYGLSALMGWTYSVPVLLIWFVVAGLQAILFTVTCVIFVSPRTLVRKVVFCNLVPVVVLTMLMTCAYFVHSRLLHALLITGVLCYLLQLALYTRYFLRVYHASVRHLEEVYDDDLSLRLVWVKRLFFSALTMGVVAAAVVVVMNQVLDVVFGFVVAAYYVYVSTSFVNYLTRAAFVVKVSAMPAEPVSAVAEAAADAPEPDSDYFEHVRAAVDRWVAEKRYLEPDMSVEEIAQQIGISRSTLNDYFSKVQQTQFRSWRIEMRIREAQRLLRDEPDIPTGELCVRCGYNDRSNFHKHFLKVTGQSLAEYRSGVQRR